ncbi:four helix bundle protein [Candidatus Gottesmanbacteria bacterium]|nr:four helix bundle protein [Candidatus Gottesmanbacteria bacterium]
MGTSDYMTIFHEHKLWQESYVALMDIHEALDKVEVEAHDEGIVKELIIVAQEVAATVADGLTRQDRRVGRDLMTKAVGQVAMTRTHLAVAWGRGLMDDETFRGLDDKYANLTSSLQSFR